MASNRTNNERQPEQGERQDVDEHLSAVGIFLELDKFVLNECDQDFRDCKYGTQSQYEVSVTIATGTGQIASPYSITESKFAQLCKDFDFSNEFKQLLANDTTLFEHRWSYETAIQNDTTTTIIPVHLDLAIGNYEHDAFFLLARWDLPRDGRPNGLLKALLFVKTHDPLKNFLPDMEQTTSIRQVHNFLRAREDILARHPILFPAVVLEFIQSRFVRAECWRRHLKEMEARIGITTHGENLAQAGYPEAELTIQGLRRANAELATLSRYIADTVLSASTTLNHAKELLRLTELFEECRRRQAANENGLCISKQREYLQATIRRLELYLRFLEMTNEVLQRLVPILYNRIARITSESTKTIALLTLWFLPATFVTTVFSVSIWDWHAHEGQQRKTVSKYWWPYVISCIGLTVSVVLFWLFWYRWISVWQEKSRLAIKRWRKRNAPPKPPDEECALSDDEEQRMQRQEQRQEGEEQQHPRGQQEQNQIEVQRSQQRRKQQQWAEEQQHPRGQQEQNQIEVQRSQQRRQQQQWAEEQQHPRRQQEQNQIKLQRIQR